jgi:hypothetical protein
MEHRKSREQSQNTERDDARPRSTRVHEVHVRDEVWTRSAAQEFKDRPQFPELRRKSTTR